MNKLTNLSFAMLMGLGISAQAQNKIETVEQCAGTVDLEEAVDYTITGTAPFATSATINIKNPDAAVVFQNIRPSVVIDKYLKYVNVNGKELKNNENCRVSVYRHGAIVLPHSDKKNADGSEFFPLTTYSGDGFTGDSAKYNGDGRYTKSPTSFPIKSFKLKRGYMVTMANNTDGTGYSHCFIANTADKEIDLSTLKYGPYLANKVGFFRIFRWQWPGKLGMSDARADELIELTNASWFYDWGAGNSTRTNAEYVPQRHHEAGQSNGQGYKGAWESFGTINSLHNLNTHILGQNEPDNTSGSGEVYTYITSIPSNPREKHGDYPLVNVAKDFLYSGMRIGTFACCNPSTGWVSEYVNWCRSHNIRIDFVATHYYIGGTSPQGCIDRLWSLYNATGLPVWATEWNNGANWTTEGGFNTDSGWYSWGGGQDQKKNGEWLRDVLKRADNEKWLERLAVYNAVEGKREIWTNGQPTEAAKVLSGYQSGFAYNDDNEYWMPWNFLNPEELTATYDKSNKHVRLNWKHYNSKQTDSICIQRLIEEESKSKWVTIKNLGMGGSINMVYNYDDLSEYSGIVKYRITNYDMDGNQRRSNEVSITIGSAMGNKTFQYGKLSITTDKEPVQVDFSEKMFESATEKPIIIMGAMTNNNPNYYPENYPYSRDTKKFIYQVLPWQKQTNASAWSKNEEIAFLATREGSGKWGELDYEIGSTSLRHKTSTKEDATIDSTEVVFAKPFPEGVTPVVFTELQNSTVEPSSTTKPISIRIWDVTNKGFKAIACYEEGNGVLASKKNAAYLAVAPGRGTIISSVDKSELTKSDTIKSETFRTETEDAYIDSIVYQMKNTYENKVGNLIVDAGIGDVPVAGLTTKIETFYNANGDTIYHKSTPLIFAELQTYNYHSAAILRGGRAYVGETTSEYYNWTYGVRVKRQVDTSSTCGESVGRVADTAGWMTLSKASTTEGEIKDETSYAIVTTPKGTGIKSIRQSEPVTNSTVKVLKPQVVGGVIKVNGVEIFDVYTMTGAKVASDAVQTAGIYVVKANGQSVKVLVK